MNSEIINKSTIADCKIIELPKIQNRAGNITPIHNMREIPFSMERLFYIYDIPGGESRGAHAHKTCQQFLIAASGSFDVIVDDGKAQKTISLNKPYYGLYIPSLIWAREFNFSSGAICLVLTSSYYDAEDYIRNYEEFIKHRSI